MPSVHVADERSADDPPVDAHALGALLGAVLAREGVGAAAEAGLTLVEPDTIAELKEAHLHGDGSPTDVLSFPLDGADAPPHGTWMVGDVVVCPSVAAAQAPDHTGSVDDELALLVVHGALHLVGWDHAGVDQQRAMWHRERELLTALHGEPARDPWSRTEP